MQKWVKYGPCPGAHSLEGEAYKKNSFNKEGMKKVQNNYKLCTEEKGSGKATQRPQISPGPWKKRRISQGEERRCISLLRLRSLKAEIMSCLSMCSWLTPRKIPNTREEPKHVCSVNEKWVDSGLISQHKGKEGGSASLGNGKSSDVAALNIVYVRQCCGDKMRHLNTRLRMPC